MAEQQSSGSVERIEARSGQGNGAIGAISNSPAVEGLVRLNLGCGTKRWEGYINVDLADNWTGTPPDVNADLRELPFPDDYADEAHAIHVIEHFQRSETTAILREWRRVLKPDGMIAIECPCLDKIAKWLVTDKLDDKTRDRLTVIGLYGEYWRGPGMQHLWCFAANELRALMCGAGFVEITLMQPLFHILQRDMRLVGFK